MVKLLLFIVASFCATVSTDKVFSKCPTISTGYYPNCECRHGPKYDIATNTCPNPECPAENSTGIYPNCTCLHKYFEYSNYKNECFRVCPENSTGYWPICKCNSDEYVFDKSEFECITCPEGSSGQYPNCTCDEDDAKYDLYRRRCEYEGNSMCPYWDSVGGKHPYCICERNGLYNESERKCYQCPYHSEGMYPNCICNDNGVYYKSENSCYECPDECDIYPNCSCENGYYSKIHNTCFECPVNSTGVYPNCECHDSEFLFSAYINECYIECPYKSSGIHPSCNCVGGNYYNTNERICKTNIGRKCPEDSIGVYPDCLCVMENFKFNSFLWQCRSKYVADGYVNPSYCPADNGKWPQCEASIDKNVLLSLIG